MGFVHRLAAFDVRHISRMSVEHVCLVVRRSSTFCVLSPSLRSQIHRKKIYSIYSYTYFHFFLLCLSFHLFVFTFILRAVAVCDRSKRRKKNEMKRWNSEYSFVVDCEKNTIFFLSFVFWECVDGVALHAAIPLTSISKLMRDPMVGVRRWTFASDAKSCRPRVQVHALRTSMPVLRVVSRFLDFFFSSRIQLNDCRRRWPAFIRSSIGYFETLPTYLESHWISHQIKSQLKLAHSKVSMGVGSDFWARQSGQWGDRNRVNAFVGACTPAHWVVELKTRHIASRLHADFMFLSSLVRVNGETFESDFYFRGSGETVTMVTHVFWVSDRVCFDCSLRKSARK